MARLLFEKTGNAVWISHLDLMRLFQRAFQRAGLPLTHTQGFNPRPSVSIALPLSVGVESVCELLDFDLEGESIPCADIQTRLNRALIPGVQVRQDYDRSSKIKELTYLNCAVDMEYDRGIPEGAAEAIEALFHREEILVEKRGKNGTAEQNIAPMVRSFQAEAAEEHTLRLRARICCQNPTLNPMQIPAAVNRHLPGLQADFAKCRRIEIYDKNENIFR